MHRRKDAKIKRERMKMLLGEDKEKEDGDEGSSEEESDI